MRQFVLLDEIHLSFSLRKTLAEKTVASARRALRGRLFQSKLRATVNQLIARYPAMRDLRVAISR